MKLDKTLRLGTRAGIGSVYVTVKYKDGKLSISGVEGPTSNGDARGSCGQCDPVRVDKYAPGWDADRVAELNKVWARWHLNHIRAGCEHQRADWDTTETIEVVTYGLTSDAHRARKALLERVGAYASRGELPDLSGTDKALLGLVDWYQPRYTPPDADSPLSGWFEVRKRENKTAGWVKPSEHPRGLLCKPCETCGHKYGTKWLREDVPESVVLFLAGLPDSDRDMPGQWGR